MNNPDLATLIVQIGMASNPLNAQFKAAETVFEQESSEAQTLRDGLESLVLTAALTNEAIATAKSRKSDLQKLATMAGAPPQLFEGIKRLCAGQHPASAFLIRARTKLGFHWDRDQIGQSVREYAKNQTIVWLESDAENLPVHRLSAEVLAHALFPDAARPNQADAESAVIVALGDMGNAINLIVEFFTAAMYGFMKSSGVIRQTRSEG